MHTSISINGSINLLELPRVIDKMLPKFKDFPCCFSTKNTGKEKEKPKPINKSKKPIICRTLLIKESPNRSGMPPNPNKVKNNPIKKRPQLLSAKVKPCLK